MRLNLARTLCRSAANGPGERFVIWVQGCPLSCRGCWNPDTWSFARRELVEVDNLAAEVLATTDIEGVTFTGGEPFAQARALAQLGSTVREAGLSVFVFTGFDLDELTSDAHRALLDVTDVLVTGRYIKGKRTLALPWQGSANQQVHFLTPRYCRADMPDSPEVEIYVGPEGGLTVTGFPPDDLLANNHSGSGVPPAPLLDPMPDSTAVATEAETCPPTPLRQHSTAVDPSQRR